MKSGLYEMQLPYYRHEDGRVPRLVFLRLTQIVGKGYERDSLCISSKVQASLLFWLREGIIALVRGSFGTEIAPVSSGWRTPRVHIRKDVGLYHTQLLVLLRSVWHLKD